MMILMMRVMIKMMLMTTTMKTMKIDDDKVDEEGSEAAALTGIILDIRTARVPQVVTVDRQVIINA